MTKIENAKIKSTMLGAEDHGILTCYLNIEGDGWGCSFGGYAFDSYDMTLKTRVGTSFGIDFINAILTTLEIDRWEKLPGTYLRVETEGWGGRILRIGHMIKNQWFDPAVLAEQYKEGESL